ncbi:acetoin utilization deacetylase AcuC-like enzyme [Mesorhizobium soli]|uniref:histone deacetylase family protein n=1 Tax=Pseudaminobacter soli (ex Li et al. 2025) TaxID=1295366 RepID=UPI002473A461|nr:histone deacetylase family protein [Mesorhizobium soli]MDH6234556.1 acetoin utilization deacetylase AcuC-like enzyme [Mesorhizobium soli]
MKAVYSDRHRLHSPGTVVEGGVARPSRDVPARLDALLRAVRRAGLAVVDAVDHGRAPLAAVHTDRYLDFLAASEGMKHGPLAPAIFESRPDAYRPDWSLIAKAGFHLRDQLTPLGEGTWQAAYWAAQVALTAAAFIREGERRAYALCRPSGHHAGRDFGGGATYLNNAAIAARALAASLGRVSLIDIDVHHGNGTQEIFWEDPDVFFASLHRSPASYYPHCTGFADETGGRSASHLTLNHPLPEETGDEAYITGFMACLNAALANKPSVLVISLGFDTLESDPAKGLQLSIEAFRKIGEMLAKIECPVLLIQEGGYDLTKLEDAALTFLLGLGV